MTSKLKWIAVCFSIGAVGFVAGRSWAAADSQKVFELRTYVTHPNRLDALNARFRDHTNKLFEKHGMTLVAYWTPTDGPTAENTLIYVLSHASRESAEKSWKAFAADPAWKAARDASEKDGPIVQKVERVYMKATDYSPMK